METIEIQGIECRYRSLRENEGVLYAERPQDDQYFRRVPVPFTDEELISIANKELTKGQYSNIQREWVDEQEKIFEEGVYAMIDGVLTFIPGSYYCYCNFWTLEHGEKPEYREDDRIFFIFHEFLRLQTDVLGVTRGKGRRQGATSIGMFFMWFIAGRKEFMNCGTTSFNEDAVKANFQKMFMFGFKSMLPCFQADFDSDSENFIRFIKAGDKRKKGVLAVKREGLNSYCDFLPNTINAYDSGRQSYNVPDEGGKRGKVNINSYWSKLYKTFLQGSKKVGFGYMPTTVNKRNEGGEAYKIFWNYANQHKIDKKTGKTRGLRTANRCVRFFMPATRCYSGCIDKFGRSVIDDPEQPILSNEGKWITEGSRTIILRERELLEGEQLMEHRRDYPLNEHDMFAFETGLCEFNEERLIAQLNELEDNPWFIRQMRMYGENHTAKNIYNGRDETWEIAKVMDDEAGNWYVLEFPEKQNAFDHRGIMSPKNDIRYSIGVDTIKSGFTINGSTATICVFKKSTIRGGIEEGLYPVAIYMGKPRLMNHLYEQVLLACKWYGCKVNFEIDAGTAFYDYFVAKDAQAFLEWTPRIAIDVTKRKTMIKPGTESANPFQLAMELEVAKKYFDGTEVGGYNGNVHRVRFPVILEQALEYDHSDRTKSDVLIALMMALLPCFGTMEINPEPPKNRPKILPQYSIKMAS